MYKKENILEFKNKFFELINGKKVLFVGHKGPDDDAVASLLGCHYKFKGQFAISGKKTNRWDYFEGYDEILFVDDVFDLEFDLVVLLDGNELSRFGDKFLENKLVVCIDHHFKDSSKKSFDLEFIDSRYSSCAEIIYDLFYRGEIIDKRVCEVLLMGLLGDTGNFNFINFEKVSVFEMAKDIIFQGKIDVQTLKSKYNSLSVETLNSLSEIFGNLKLEKIGDWPLFAYSFLEKDDDFADHAAAIFKNNYSRNIDGVSWGVTIRKKEKGFSYSFRSIPESVNVRLLCEALKIGGGHDRAAGGFYECDTLNEAESLVFDFLKKNSFEKFR